MRDISEKRKKHTVRKAIYSWPVIAVLCVLTVLMCVGAWNTYKKERTTRETLEQVTGVYDELHVREEQLAADVAALETSFGVESEIRDRFGLVREGEEQVIIIDEGDKKSENGEVPKKKHWWQKFKEIF